MIDPTTLSVPARPFTRWALRRHLAALSQAFQRLPQSLIALLARVLIAALLPSLMAGGPGRWSIDPWLAPRGPR
jgi:hypothetical protein